MIIKQLLPGAIQILDMVNEEKAMSFLDELKDKPHRKFDTTRSRCDAIQFTPSHNAWMLPLVSSYFWDVLQTIHKISERIYGTKLVQNDFGHLLIMSDQSFLEKHEDRETAINCVFYFEECPKDRWWQLILWHTEEQVFIDPIPWSVVVFTWATPHAVETYKGEGIRRSFAVGFSTPDTMERNRVFFSEAFKIGELEV